MEGSRRKGEEEEMGDCERGERGGTTPPS